jgi:hypothetical protein
MKQVPILLFSLLLFCFSCKTAKTHVEKVEDQKWVSLFNGKNLDNWIPKIAGYKVGENYGNTFRVENGVLSVRYDQYDSFKNRFGALYYNKNFSNYRLKVEYRFVGDTVKGAPSWGFHDSGIQYFCQSPQSLLLQQPFPVCLEYNLLGTRPTGEICANGMYVEIDGKRNASYCTPPTVKRTISGDDWVTAEIDVNNGTITHFVNGEKILEFTNPRYDSANVIGKTFIKEGNDIVKDGYISLQSNSNPIDFRKIEILEY